MVRRNRLGWSCERLRPLGAVEGGHAGHLPYLYMPSTASRASNPSWPNTNLHHLFADLADKQVTCLESSARLLTAEC